MQNVTDIISLAKNGDYGIPPTERVHSLTMLIDLSQFLNRFIYSTDLLER